MALKNFNRVVAETPPEIKEKVERWMDEQEKLHEGKCNLCVVYGQVAPVTRGTSVEIDGGLRPPPVVVWTKEALDDLEDYFAKYDLYNGEVHLLP